MLWWLAETTLVAAALAGAVALLCRRLRPRPAVRHALWLVVLLKLLTPPLLAWPWSPPGAVPLAAEPPVATAPRPPPAEEAVAEPTADESLTVVPPAEAPVESVPAESGPAPVAEAGLPAEDEAPTPAARPVARAARPRAERLAPAFVGAWVAGAVLMAVLQAVRIARFRRQAGRGGPAPPALTAAVRELATRLGVRPPPVVVLPDLASPVVWGLGRPRLLWPVELLGRLSADGERTAIVHELAHLRRRDHWVGWLQLAASCVWWWSPLFWHVRRQVGRAAELACDAWVIEVLPQARRAYAEALLEVCELVSRRAAPAPALGMGGARQEIERRLTMILRESVPSRVPVRALFGVVLLALIALPGLTDGQPGPDLSRATDPAASKVAADFTAQPTAKPASDDRERRLQKLEASLEMLLKEVRDLRGAAAKQPATNGSKPTDGWNVEVLPSIEYRVPVSLSTTYEFAKSAPASDKPIQLVRVTYKLPKDKAEALVAALKGVKAPVLETQLQADGIVITTTPEIDRVVGEFVGLLQGHAPAAKPAAHYPAVNNGVPQTK